MSTTFAEVPQSSQAEPRARSRKDSGCLWRSRGLRTLAAGSAGNFGYSLFAISRSDLRRLRDLHLEYVRAPRSRQRD